MSSHGAHRQQTNRLRQWVFTVSVVVGVALGLYLALSAIPSAVRPTFVTGTASSTG